MKKLLLLLLLIPNLVMGENSPLNNKGLICVPVAECGRHDTSKASGKEKEIIELINKFDAQLNSSKHCIDNFISYPHYDEITGTTSYMDNIKSVYWFENNKCIIPNVKGYKILDIPYPISITTDSITIYTGVNSTLDRKTLILASPLGRNQYYYERCIVTENKKDIYKSAREKIKKAKEENKI